MSALPKVSAVITARLDQYTRDALRAVVAEAGRGVTLQYDPVPVPLPEIVAPVAAPPAPRGPGMNELIAAAAYETGVSPARIRGDGRCRAEVRARFGVAWAAREVLGLSSTTIGRALGDRDHATILHAWKRAQALLAGDPAFRLLAERLRTAVAAMQ